MIKFCKEDWDFIAMSLMVASNVFYIQQDKEGSIQAKKLHDYIQHKLNETEKEN